MDILIPIKDECLPQLSEMYRNVNWAPYVHSFIETAIMWRKKGRKELTIFWSPDNSWKENGTFIALMQFGNYDLFMFTLDPSCTHLCKGLLETKRINWRKPTLLFNIHFLHYPFILKTFEDMNLVVNFSIIHDMYFLDKEVALNQPIQCPSEVYLKELDKADAPTIDSLYKSHRYRYPDGDKFISTLIEMNQGYEMMSECHNEILMNIPDEDLEQLAGMYKDNDDIPYASSIITNGIKIRRKRSFFIRFMSPGNCWRDDGTFFALMEFPHSYDLAVFTLDKMCKNVYEGLMKTKRLHFERPLVFFAIHNSIYPTIQKVIKERKLHVKSDNAYYIYSIPKAEAVEFKIECPEEVELRELDISHSSIVNSPWPQKFPNSEEYVSSLIEMNEGYGLFLKSTNELVSWGVKTGLGQLGIVQTVENHTKKGYASIVTKMLSKSIAEDDENPTGTVAITNTPSQNMFRKLGFENRGTCHYITLEKAGYINR